MRETCATILCRGDIQLALRLRLCLECGPTAIHTHDPRPYVPQLSRLFSFPDGLEDDDADVLAAPRAKKEKPVKSACAAGTIFKGLNIMKAGQDPVALAESDYPPFLWKLLDRSDIGEKKEARSVNRAQIKRKNFFSGKL